MEIVFCGTGWGALVDVVRARLPPGWSIRSRSFARSLAEDIAGADVVLPSNAPFDRAAIFAAERLRLIQQPAVGYEGIDLDAARARGIPVCNAPGTNGQSVAEAALLLLLALARRVPGATNAFAERVIGAPVGVELSGRPLVVLGFGESGQRLGAAATALGMEVRGVRSADGRAGLLEAARGAGALSVHCPLTPATRGLVDREVLGALAPGAFVVNCARGPIVDRTALEDALASGHLGGAGLDVHWEEPWDPSEALYRRDDVVSLPHIAGSTSESFGRIADIVVDNVGRLARGEPLLHRVA